MLGIRRILLGVVLITAVASGLIMTDRTTASHKHVVWVLAWAETLPVEESIAGFRAGLADAGFSTNDTLELVVRNAQLDVGTLSMIVAQAIEAKPDLIATITTPATQAVMGRASGIDIVFMTVASPALIGIGATPSEHLPHITGVACASDYVGIARIIPEVLPSTRTAGAIFCPSEMNSVFNIKEGTCELAKNGITLTATPAEKVSDAPAAVQELIANHPDVLIVFSDSLSSSSAPAIIAAAQKARIPVFGVNSDTVNLGAVLSVSRDFVDLAHDAGTIAARILNGEQAAAIPYVLPAKSQLIVNIDAARQLGIEIPDAVKSRAWRVIERKVNP
ncbi:MAG: hypothetical protein EXS17_06565 [Phycisphaerales bacterium]|nr:hypothetical protein [Phycisphaerales bacterium]